MRSQDVSGVSGVGHVADGITFYDGTTVVYWRTVVASLVVFKDLESMIKIHGHGGTTSVEWVD